MKMKDCVLITSVIHTTNSPLNYSSVRSIYSHKERYEQTIETIDSIRKYMPNVDIAMIECSQPSEYLEDLEKRVDYFINLEFNEVVNLKTEKGKGEATLLLHALNILKDKYENIYKITGRYVLQNTFNINDWNNQDLITACRTNKYGMENSIHTFFYKIPKSKISLLTMILNNYIMYTFNESIENFIASRLKDSIYFIDHIGILARWACYNELAIF